MESKVNVFREIIIETDLEDKLEQVLEQELNQQYNNVQKYRFDHTYGRTNEFWRVILQVNVFKKLKSSLIPIIFGHHIVYLKDLILNS